jgi:hypothetical protein
MKALPWILVVLLSGGVYFLFSANKEKSAQLAAMQDQVAEVATLRAENDQLHQLPASGEDAARQKKDNEELVRLRGENQRLKNEARQAAAKLAAAQSGGSKEDQARQQQLNKLSEENDALKASQAAQAANAGGAGQSPAQQQASSCIANLRQLAAAKQLWAQDNKAGPDMVPDVADLKPYLPDIEKMTCPAGGTYEINTVSSPPTCSIPSHTLAPQIAAPAAQ